MDAERTNGDGDDAALGSADDVRVALARLLGVTESALERRAQLEHALSSRIVIEQAKGVLAERFGLRVDDAFELLRRAARSHGMRLRALAEAVVSSRETPPEVARVLAAARADRGAAPRAPRARRPAS